uniref:Uncharacterized protein n=1 Tax=Oryza meridionalis TaxID=40149 RepID=A0A0E0D541_9ORYZ
MGSRLKQQRGGRRGGQSIKEEEEGKGKQCEEEEGEEASGPRGEASKWESPHHHVAGSRGLCWRRPNPRTSSSFPPRPLRYFFLYSLHSFRRRRSRSRRERREQRQSSQAQVRCAVRAAARGAAHVGGGALAAAVVVVAPVASWAWSARFYRRRMATGESDSDLGGRGQVEVAKRIRLEASAVKDFRLVALFVTPPSRGAPPSHAHPLRRGSLLPQATAATTSSREQRAQAVSVTAGSSHRHGSLLHQATAATTSSREQCAQGVSVTAGSSHHRRRRGSVRETPSPSSIHARCRCRRRGSVHKTLPLSSWIRRARGRDANIVGPSLPSPGPPPQRGRDAACCSRELRHRRVCELVDPEEEVLGRENGFGTLGKKEEGSGWRCGVQLNAYYSPYTPWEIARV